MRPTEQRRRKDHRTIAQTSFLWGAYSERSLFAGEVPQGAGYRRIETVAPNFVYLDALVGMIQQSPNQRPSSIGLVKDAGFLLRGVRVATPLQKLDEVQKCRGFSCQSR